MENKTFLALEVNQSNLEEYYKFYRDNLTENQKQFKSLKLFENQLKKGVRFFFVKDKKGETVGTFFLFKNKTTTSIFGIPFFAKNTLDFGGLSVAKKLQRSDDKGLASGKVTLGIIKAAEEVAKKMGAKRLNVMIEGNNPHWRQNLARGSKGIFRYKTSRTLTAKMRMGAWYSKVVKKKKVPKITVLTKRLK